MDFFATAVVQAVLNPINGRMAFDEDIMGSPQDDAPDDIFIDTEPTSPS